jgi:hypothetical protein
MPRGSKPGERRGGRQRATPNRRTVLTDRILAAAAANPMVGPRELVFILAMDHSLPADARMAVAGKAFPFGPSRSMHGRSATPIAHLAQPTEPVTKIRPDHAINNKRPASKKGPAIGAKAGLALDLLFTVVQDTAASLADRRKAASKAAEFFLPKSARGKKSLRGTFPPDEHGFVVDPELARELRDSKLKLNCLHLAKKPTPDAIAREARKLQARIEEIQQSLQCPCPSKYETKHVRQDKERVEVLNHRRTLGEVFLPEEDAEEALRMARYYSFFNSPEVATRRRLTDLRERKRAADKGYGPPVTRAQKTTLRFLTLLYPSSPPPSPDKMTIAQHPFHDFPPPFVVGNPNYPEFYP